jgi:hypothetical protein
LKGGRCPAQHTPHTQTNRDYVLMLEFLEHLDFPESRAVDAIGCLLPVAEFYLYQKSALKEGKK